MVTPLRPGVPGGLHTGVDYLESSTHHRKRLKNKLLPVRVGQLTVRRSRDVAIARTPVVDPEVTRARPSAKQDSNRAQVE